MRSKHLSALGRHNRPISGLSRHSKRSAPASRAADLGEINHKLRLPSLPGSGMVTDPLRQVCRIETDRMAAMFLSTRKWLLTTASACLCSTALVALPVLADGLPGAIDTANLVKFNERDYRIDYADWV